MAEDGLYMPHHIQNTKILKDLVWCSHIQKEPKRNSAVLLSLETS